MTEAFTSHISNQVRRITQERFAYDFHRTFKSPGFRIIHLQSKWDVPVMNTRANHGVTKPLYNLRNVKHETFLRLVVVKKHWIHQIVQFKRAEYTQDFLNSTQALSIEDQFFTRVGQLTIWRDSQQN